MTLLFRIMVELTVKSTGIKRAPIDDLFYIRSEYRNSEDIDETDGIGDNWFNCLDSGPVCGDIALGTLTNILDRSSNFDIGRPISSNSMSSDEDNIGGATSGDFTLKYHIDQIG